MDFTPDMLSNGGIFTQPKYEIFSNVVNKASNWCISQQGIRILNAQSFEMKIKKGNILFITIFRKLRRQVGWRGAIVELG